MKKLIFEKIQNYLSLHDHPSLDKKESAEIITQELLNDPQFKKNLHLNSIERIQSEIKDIVYEMIQKKTYGFFSIKDYLQKTKKK